MLSLCIWRLVSYAGGMRYPDDGGLDAARCATGGRWLQPESYLRAIKGELDARAEPWRPPPTRRSVLVGVMCAKRAPASAGR